MNSRLSQLNAYPFARLETLLSGLTPNADYDFISLAIGEPKHLCPESSIEALQQSYSELQKYPVTSGKLELKGCIANWANERFDLNDNLLNPKTQILPVNGTREALFAITQLVANPDRSGTIGMPNPFYQIYEGAAILAGKTPVYFNNSSANNMQPDWRNIPTEEWQQTELLYICSPGNPSGTYISLEDMYYLIKMADRHDFIIVSDECYCELYLDPNHKAPSILEACKKMGRKDFNRCLSVQSLSKRSNLPGLRSGFVAGDTELIKQFLLYRTYHGSAMPGMVQQASIAAWQDEAHAENNREIYRQKYKQILPKLKGHFDYIEPQAGFYLWLSTPIDDQKYCQDLYQKYNLKVLPGSLLARDSYGENPGKNKIRIALVASIDECIQGIDRLLTYNSTL